MQRAGAAETSRRDGAGLSLLLKLLLGLIACALWLAPSALAKERPHQVRSGQTLWGISKRYKVSVEALIDRNRLSQQGTLRAGQTLVIPDPSYQPGDRERAGDRPAAYTQVQKSARDRGVNPCNTPDPGLGVFAKWDRSPSLGQMIVPERGGLTSGGQFDVLIHFHGHEAARKEWVKAVNGTVLVGIDLGEGSGKYSSVFQSPHAFKTLLSSIEAGVAAHAERDNTTIRHLGLSAWSAGYGAVQEILGTAFGQKRVDSVILLDGLHTGYRSAKQPAPQLNEQQIGAFTRFAKKASRGQKLMFVSHSSIIPHGYASTTETANLLVKQLGGIATAARTRPSDPMGLELISRYTIGNFHMRGFSGNDKMDHCAHLGLLGDVARVHLARRWRSPQGKKSR